MSDPVFLARMPHNKVRAFTKHVHKHYAKAMVDAGEYITLDQALNAAKKEASQFHQQSAQYAFYPYEICEKKTKKHVGQLSVAINRAGLPMGFLTYLEIEIKELRKGYGTSAVEALLVILAKEHGVTKIMLSVMQNNQAAVALYSKLGFTVERHYASGVAQYHSRMLMEKTF